MLKRIKIVTSLLLVLAVFGLLQLTSGGLFFNARKLYISLTKEGQALYNRAQTQIEEAYRQIEAQFTAEKMQQLTHLLEEFIALGNSRQEAIPGDNE